MASQGKRMVPEKLIKEIGQGGGGATYTAGEGISIDANNEISANIKAGSGIVVDTDLTDDSLVVMVDQADIPYKSDLATVATTGDYDDLTNKPTIPVEVKFTDVVDIGDNDEANITSDQVAEIKNGTKRLKARGWIFELSFDVSETDDQLILNPSTTNAITNDSNIINGHYAIITVSTGRVHIYTTQYNNVVSANTGATPTATLTDISVGGSVYSIPTGTTVVANSTATPSATLTTLQVGTDTYEVPQGGGSSYTAGNGIYINNDTISVYSTNMDIPAQSLSIKGRGTSASDDASPNGNLALGRLSKSTSTDNSYGSLDMFAYYKYGTSYAGVTDNCAITFWAGYGTNSWRKTGDLSANGKSINLRNKVSDGNITISNEGGNQSFSMFSSGTMRFINGSNNIINVPQASGTITLNLPECPTTTDGTYVLKATVSSGVVTYAWVPEV